MTPHLVRLASELESKPFHLIATHCQNNSRDKVLQYLRSQEFDPSSPNMTITSFGGHSRVKGNGHVPYYMVFDHRGKLAHHHMGGAYHGGDGLGMAEWVNKLLQDAPALYLGEEPYRHIPDLAEQVSNKKRLGAAVAIIDKALADDSGKHDAATRAEYQRLHRTVDRYRNAEIQRTLRRMATTPSSVVSGLEDLEKELKGSSMAQQLASQIAELEKSDDLKQSLALEKTFARSRRSIDRLIDKGAAQKTVAKQLDKLLQATEGKDDLPIAATIKDYVERTRDPSARLQSIH